VTFGYDTFRPGQAEVIEAVLGGHDCIAVMPTGAGKSLTFQLPARLLLDGTVLVISPLIS
jgi:ATP-dependent DNA helicase RecQ